MQKLGKASNVTPSGNIIIKTANPPKIGLEVVDENLKVVGRVFDIIGPVSSPYAVVKSTVREPATLVNKPLYLLLSKTKRSKKRYD
ncbi:MAG: Gar1/Naf1 family protein [Candidatus Bathyarchaeota archaeon]|nr:Gar1/Naf1 family protein [Candidatus Bathyarchaeota archaeon]